MHPRFDNAGLIKDRLFPSSSRVALWLVLAGMVAVAAVSVRVYSNYAAMQRSIREEGWVEHSQAVLANLQGESQQLDRADLMSQLFVATGERPRYRGASSAVSNMGVALTQLEDLVKDNASQTRHAHELEEDLKALSAGVAAEDETKKAPDRQILACRMAIGILQGEERGLLEDRTAAYKADTYASFVAAVTFLGGALVMLVGLIALLMRGTLRHRAMEDRLLAAKAELEANVSKLTGKAAESELLTSTRDELQLCMTAEQAHETTVRRMELLLPGTNGALLVINNSRRMVEVEATWGGPTGLQDGFSPEACCGLRAGRARWRQKGKSELQCTHFAGSAPEAYLCVPLAAHGETLGFLYVGCATAECVALAEERMPLISELAELASLSIASLKLRAKLEVQSIRDALTGLFNRHFMEIALEREMHRAQRQGTSVAVVMLDVDHFKRLNDTFGHETGDAVLREVAECFRKTLREEDVICRYGGEEFVVIMPDVGEETALRRTEKIRASVEKLQTFVRGQLIGAVTVSAGVAMFPGASRDSKDLLEMADAALYRAKRAGRNRVEMAMVEELVGLG